MAEILAAMASTCINNVQLMRKYLNRYTSMALNNTAEKFIKSHVFPFFGKILFFVALTGAPVKNNKL